MKCFIGRVQLQRTAVKADQVLPLNALGAWTITSFTLSISQRASRVMWLQQYRVMAKWNCSSIGSWIATETTIHTVTAVLSPQTALEMNRNTSHEYVGGGSSSHFLLLESKSSSWQATGKNSLYVQMSIKWHMGQAPLLVAVPFLIIISPKEDMVMLPLTGLFLKSHKQL